MRRQPPVHSPLTLGDVLRATAGGGGGAGSPRWAPWRRAGPEHERAGAPPAERLRLRLARRLEVAPDRIVLTGSGTQALGLALEAVLRSRGAGPVAVPGYTCWDVGTAVQAAGAEARFFDIDPSDLTPDLESVEAALSDGARALVVSPLFGYPVDWAALWDLAEARGAVLVEDAAQAHGSRWAGHSVPGTAGRLGVLSFARGKGWTGGGGGALVVHSTEVAVHVGRPSPPSRMASTPRWLAAALAQAVAARPGLYGLPASLPWLGLGQSTYHPPAPPRGMTAAEAGLLLSTEAAAEAEARRRRRRATLLLRRLSGTSRVRPPRPAGTGTPGFLRLPVLVEDPPPGWVRAAARLGVVRAYPKALPDVPELASTHPSSLPPLPGARLLARRLFTVPTHSLVDTEEEDRTVRLLAEI